MTLVIKNDLWNDTTFRSPVPVDHDNTLTSWETRYSGLSGDIGLEEAVIKPNSGVAFDPVIRAFREL